MGGKLIIIINDSMCVLNKMFTSYASLNYHFFSNSSPLSFTYVLLRLLISDHILEQLCLQSESFRFRVVHTTTFPSSNVTDTEQTIMGTEKRKKNNNFVSNM